MCFACTRDQGLSIGFVALEVANHVGNGGCNQALQNIADAESLSSRGQLGHKLALRDTRRHLGLLNVKMAHVSHKPKGDGCHGCPLSTYKAKTESCRTTEWKHDFSSHNALRPGQWNLKHIFETYESKTYVQYISVHLVWNIRAPSCCFFAPHLCQWRCHPVAFALNPTLQASESPSIWNSKLQDHSWKYWRRRNIRIDGVFQPYQYPAFASAVQPLGQTALVASWGKSNAPDATRWFAWKLAFQGQGELKGTSHPTSSVKSR